MQVRSVAPAQGPLRRRRWRRRLFAAVALLVVAALVATFVACWAIAGAVTRPDHKTAFKLRILAAGDGTVTLAANAEAGPGEFGLAWRTGSTAAPAEGILGPVVSADHQRVTRRLTSSQPGPRVGDQARILTQVWTSNPKAALGLDYSSVAYPDPLGPMPAWFVPGTRSTWAIEVHGYDGDPTTGLRVMPTLHGLGYPILDISYRNDAGAPSSSDHRVHLGDTEWQDLAAAVTYATSHGASAVILCGWSMGGGIVENYLHRASHIPPVKAVVLDAPALDWNAIFAFQAHRLGLPSVFADAEETVLGLRTGINLDRINMLAANRSSGGPHQPVLLFHGTADAVVPFATSATFAHEWPTQVAWNPVSGAGHTQSWNLNPQRYDLALTTFLNRVDPT